MFEEEKNSLFIINCVVSKFNSLSISDYANTVEITSNQYFTRLA